MNRAWLTDLLTSLAIAAIAAGLVLILGGPVWAALGFAIVVYLAHDPINQRAVAK